MERAAQFREVRAKQLKRVAEDYAELIADLIETKGKARACDLAKQMGITHVSVLKTIKRLIRDGYLVEGIHPLIDLTEKGKSTAAFSKKKHSILYDFLLKLGIPDHIAAMDVEGMEHHVSPETLNAIDSLSKSLSL